MFVNADETARTLQAAGTAASALKAGRLVLLQLDHLIKARQDFIYETTLSSHQSVNLLKRAAGAGYETLLIFVVLAAPELHVRRVAQRVSRGGHDIPEPIIRRRYDLTFKNLAVCLRISDAAMIFDNSSSGARLVLEVNGMTVSDYADRNNPLDRRILDLVARS